MHATLPMFWQANSQPRVRALSEDFVTLLQHMDALRAELAQFALNEAELGQSIC